MSLPLPVLAARYALFAAVAVAVNLATQAASLGLYEGRFALPLAMALGTGTGLVTKYILDKRFIFYDREGGLRAQSRKFTLYTAMGVATTALFWATELAFAALGEDPRLKYLGGALGLTLGYIAKYRLDRRFVFRPGAA